MVTLGAALNEEVAMVPLPTLATVVDVLLVALVVATGVLGGLGLIRVAGREPGPADWSVSPSSEHRRSPRG